MTFKNRGFSLIEVLVSLLLMAVGVLGVVKMQSFMEVKAENSLNALEALHFAEERLEYYRTRSQAGAGGTISYKSIVDDEDNVILNKISATRIVTVKDDSPVIGSKTVHVVVIWKDRWNKEQKVMLKTVISKYSEFD
ncbi:type IV pilus modification PilV family protein [Photobacterium ganghwense]|uniref:type IV pilus modification PilV family protein n=1 Tax=Photobacterium ganghwense TaxID=320778 RepID=UPI004055B5E8